MCLLCFYQIHRGGNTHVPRVLSGRSPKSISRALIRTGVRHFTLIPVPQEGHATTRTEGLKKRVLPKFATVGQCVRNTSMRRSVHRWEVTSLLSSPVVFCHTLSNLGKTHFFQSLYPSGGMAELYLTKSFHTLITLSALLYQGERRSPSHCWVGQIHSLICHHEWDLTTALCAVLPVCAKHSPRTCPCYHVAVSLSFRDAKCTCLLPNLI